MAKSRNSRAAAGRPKTSSKKPATAETARRPAKGATTRSKASSPPRQTRRSPLERAQQLIYEAFGYRDPDRQIRLAQKALALSPDCADAYSMLAEYAPDSQQALMLCAEGVAAAERGMGAKLLQSEPGTFWAVAETRPYMRARLALAQRLWIAGQRRESIEHLEELLRLNPHDNQGVRYILAARLLEEGKDGELPALLEKYDEPSTFWAFSKALAAFRRGGDTDAARRLLQKARKQNKHVTKLLLEKSAELPVNHGAYSPGDAREAAIYLEDFSGGWRQSPGAITWLRRMTAASKLRKRSVVEATGPTAAVKQRLLRLPQRFGDEWQASAHRLPTWVEDAGLPQRPWAFLIVDHSAHTVVGQDMIVQRPTAEQMFDRLVEAMERPLVGVPHRPSEIQVREEPAWEAIRPHLEEIGVDCIFRSELDEISYIQGQMREMFLAEQPLHGLVDLPRIDLSQVAGLFAAADVFYRQAPWRRLAVETAIRVECGRFRKYRDAPWYAAVMGQSNLTLGLALYEDLEAIHELWWGAMSDPLAGKSLNTMAVMYGEAFEIAMSDLLACEEHEWPLGGPEAYPQVLCTRPGVPLSPPEAWELHLLEGCLRAIPQFVKRHEKFEGPIEETITVPTASGALELKLSWTPESDACGGDCEDCDDACADHHESSKRP